MSWLARLAMRLGLVRPADRKAARRADRVIGHADAVLDDYHKERAKLRLIRVSDGFRNADRAAYRGPERRQSAR